jgi:hypothetical protein
MNFTIKQYKFQKIIFRFDFSFSKFSVSKKILYIAILIAVLASTIFALYFFNILNNNMDKPIQSDVAKIVSLSPYEYWGNPVGMTMDLWFNVTIYNEGVNDIEGLTLNISISDTPNDIYDVGTTAETSVIHAGETKVEQWFILTGFDHLNDVAGHTVEVKLLLGDKVLDEGMMILPTRAFG